MTAFVWLLRNFHVGSVKLVVRVSVRLVDGLDGLCGVFENIQRVKILTYLM